MVDVVSRNSAAGAPAVVPVTDTDGNKSLAQAVVVVGAGGALIDPTPLRATNTSRIVSAAASTNATSAKASAGTVLQITGYNAAASARFLKFYDKATAPTVGTDAPRKTIYLPATSAFAIDCRDAYATGIAYALTTGVADNDTGALTAADVLALNVDYV